MREICHWTICGFVFLAMLAGCGRPGPELSSVTGRVTLDGQPVQGARLMFQPETNGSPSYGATDQEGRYELGYKRGVNGAMIGPHIVRIQLDTPVLDSSGKAKSLPPRYNTQSELRAEVESGKENVINFDLTSEPR